MTDPIADMLARIRNAVMVKHESLEMPSSRLKLAIAKLMKDERFIDNYRLAREGGKDKLKITLSYFEGKSVINGLNRISKPGRRVYCQKDDIPVINKGIGMAVISTSKGVLTDSQSRHNGIGGEILLTVW
jgi:small subunit ribosomal protein S8